MIRAGLVVLLVVKETFVFLPVKKFAVCQHCVRVN